MPRADDDTPADKPAEVSENTQSITKENKSGRVWRRTFTKKQ